MKKIILLTTVFFCCLQTISYAQHAGELDPSFGNKGIVNTDFGSSTQIYSSSARQVLISPDGTIYVIIENTITRLLDNGTIDSSYGRNGYARPVFQIASGVLQPDGKIVVTGSATDNSTGSDFALARYNTDGTLDTIFSTDGMQTTDFGSRVDVANSVAIQSDGKIVVAGYTNTYGGGSIYSDFDEFAVARYNTDGTLDTAFSGDGKLTTHFTGGARASSVAIQSDGKIVVVGQYIARYNTNGTLDTTFSTDGKLPLENYANAVAIQNDGKILAAGGRLNNFVVTRYNTNGTLDTTFSEDGKQTTRFGSAYDFVSASSMTIQKDGKIILAGGNTIDFALARYNTDGSLDSTFSEDGKQTTDFGYAYENANSIALQPNGKIVVVGGSLVDNENNIYSFSFARYNTDGSLDNTFSEDGKVTDYLHAGSTIYNSTAVQSDGKIVVAGSTQQGTSTVFAVARYNINGTLDTTFSADGKQTTDFEFVGDVAKSVAIQSDGKIVVAGYTNAESEYAAHFAVARYNTNGTLDSTFSEDGKLTANFEFGNNIASTVVIQNDGKILVAGTVIARYNTDGSLDSTFSGDGIQKADFTVASAAIQSNGKIVVAGGRNIARYNTDGTLDFTFSEDGKQDTDSALDYSLVYSLALQNDGKIVVSGGSDKFTLARYNTDGLLDTTFSDDGKQSIDFPSGDNDYPSSLVIQSDGKIIVGGQTRNAENRNFALARFNTDGSIDSSFAEDGKQVTEAEGTDFLNDLAIFGNKLYAVGWGNTIGNVGVVARYFLTDETKTPTVTLSIPNNTINYTTPARIKLNASVANASGMIKKVQFFRDSTVLHTEDVFPYGFLWIDVPAGNYTLTAKAFDNSGNVITSNSINVSVVNENVPPVVSIVSPVADTTYSGPATIRLIANAKDPNDKISKVEFYNGATLLRTEYYYPYTYTWTNVQPGTYTITAKAYDDKGLSATSAPITVNVTAPMEPIVSRPSSIDSKTDLNGALSLTLSPNPARSTLQIFTKGLQLNKHSTISVISATGVVMKTIQSNASDKVVQLDVSSMVSGVYAIKVVSGDKVMYKQFVKL